MDDLRIIREKGDESAPRDEIQRQKILKKGKRDTDPGAGNIWSFKTIGGENGGHFKYNIKDKTITIYDFYEEDECGIDSCATGDYPFTFHTHPILKSEINDKPPNVKDFDEYLLTKHPDQEYEDGQNNYQRSFYIYDSDKRKACKYEYKYTLKMPNNIKIPVNLKINNMKKPFKEKNLKVI